MKRLAISLCLVLALTTALVGCGEKKEDDVQPVQTVEPSQTNEPVEDSSEDVKPEQTQKPVAEKPETTEKPVQTAEPENKTEESATDYSKGKFAIETETDTIVFENGEMIIHFHEDENGKDSLTLEDGTIEYSEYYGKTLEEIKKDFEDKKLVVAVYEL